MTVTATYTKLYTVTFIKRVGTTLTTKQVKDGEKLGLDCPAVPTETGYTDGVWKTTDGTTFDGNTVVTSDMTVTATYTAVKYTVTFVAECDGVQFATLGSQEVQYGKKPIFTPSTVIDINGDEVNDYYLWGWEEEAEAKLIEITEATQIVVPYAPYDEIGEVRVRIIDGDILVGPTLYRSGETKKITLPAAPTVEDGKVFKGWGTVYSGDEYSTGLKEGTSASTPGYVYYDFENLYEPGSKITPDSSMSVSGGVNIDIVGKIVDAFTISFENESGTVYDSMKVEQDEYFQFPSFNSEKYTLSGSTIPEGQSCVGYKIKGGDGSLAYWLDGTYYTIDSNITLIPVFSTS